MGKQRQRRALQLEDDQASCMWGLISIFHIHNGRSNRKLLIDRKHGSRSPVGDNAKLKMLTSKDDNCQTTEDREEITTDALKTRVQKLTEDDMSSEQGLKKNMNIYGVQPDKLNLENGGNFRDKPKESESHHSKSCDLHSVDFDVTEHSSHQLLNQKTAYNLDLEVMLDELCLLSQKGGSCKHDWHENRSNLPYSLAQERLGAAIKVFISQRFSDDDHLAEEGDILHSKEFIDALEYLGANKELFSEHLHDPDSLLAKHIQSFENGQLTKVQHNNPLFESNLLDKESNKPSSGKLADRKHHSFFRRRRRSKSQDCIPLKDDDKCQPSSSIVILKPGSKALQNSGGKSLDGTSLESRCGMTDRSQNGRNGSQFSLSEIKRKLKHVMRIQWHGVSGKSKYPYNFQHLKNHEKGSVQGNSGWSSPNRNHFYNERFAKSPLGIKRGDKIDKSEEYETTLLNELNWKSKQGPSNIYNQAKKHLSEILNSAEVKEELVSRQSPKTLARILSLPDHSSTPCVSPGKNDKNNFVTAQVGSNPHGGLHITQENMPCIIEDKHTSEQCPSKQCLESDSCISGEQLNEKVQSCNIEPDILGELVHDQIVERDKFSTQEDKICEELLEVVATKSNLEEDIQVEDVPCESSSLHFIREIEIHDATEISDEEESPRILIMYSTEEDVVIQSPPVSPTRTAASMNIESSDNYIDKAERPSPISVLEPYNSEDDISPASSKVSSVTEVIEPLHICFDEWDSSDVNQAVCIRTCMENEESAFEYVEAVLLGSGLNWDEYLLRWLSSDQILDPSLFDEVELFSSRSHDQKLLFDCTNKVLLETCERYFTRSCVKQGNRPVPNGTKLINEVWEGVEMKVLQHPAPHSLDQLVRKDMPKLGKWMDLYFETDHIVIELESFIIDEMVEEILLSSDDRSMEDRFSIHASVKDEEIVINM